MADKIRVSTTQIGNAASNIGQIVSSMKSDIDSMFDGINGLNSMWDGDAHDAFVSSAQTDRERLLEVIDEINTIMQKLEEAQREYESCERTVASEIQSIQV